MYYGSWKIDDYLTFTVNTHTASTGAATDADSAPSYRIYEDETGTPIVTGSMALLDNANTTGFYSERVQLTSGSGFEKGRCYNIYISATVDSITGTISHMFQIEAEVDANSVSDEVALEDDAITADKYDESTAFPLGSADTGATAVARTGADSDTLETLSDQLDGVVEDTEDLQAQIGTDGDGLAAIPWNSDWDAEAQSECTDALNAYDPPTRGELTSDISGLNDPSATDIADELLTRDWTSVTGEAARSVLNALRFLRNKWSVSGNTMTVYEEDDSTSAWTASVTDDADADPITAIDPA